MTRGYEYDMIRTIPKVFSDTVRALNADERQAFITYAENLDKNGVDISDILSEIKEDTRIPFIKATIATFMQSYN